MLEFVFLAKVELAGKYWQALCQFPVKTQKKGNHNNAPSLPCPSVFNQNARKEPPDDLTFEDMSYKDSFAGRSKV